MTPTSGSVLAGLAGLALVAVAAAAAEPAWQLLLFDEEECPYCIRWEAEVGAVYPHTPEGRRAPLVRTALAEGVPDGVRLERPVRYTPTFVLLDAAGRERGRITGYLGEEQFWGLLEMLLDKAGTP